MTDVTIVGDPDKCGACGVDVGDDALYVRESRRLNTWLPVCDEFCLAEIYHLRDEPTVEDLDDVPDSDIGAVEAEFHNADWPSNTASDGHSDNNDE